MSDGQALLRSNRCFSGKWGLSDLFLENEVVFDRLLRMNEIRGKELILFSMLIVPPSIIVNTARVFFHLSGMKMC